MTLRIYTAANGDGRSQGAGRLRRFLAPVALAFLSACSQQGADEAAPVPAAESSPVAEDDDHIIDRDGQWRRYDNARFDFAIDLPPGLVAQPKPQNGDGRLFIKDERRLRVSGRYNLDSTFDEQIADASKGLTILEQERASPATWRATATLDGGKRVALLLARAAERIITARFEYPDNEPAAADQAERTLTSLLLLGHAGSLTYAYRPGRYASVPVTFSLPGARDWPVEGEKLIPWDRAGQLGELSCRYGLSGEAGPCVAEKEAGLTFAVIDRPLARLRQKVPAALVEPSKLAGREGITVVEQAEGSGTSYMLIPAGPQTIAVVRRWEKDADETDYRAILRTVSFEIDSH